MFEQNFYNQQYVITVPEGATVSLALDRSPYTWTSVNCPTSNITLQATNAMDMDLEDDATWADIDTGKKLIFTPGPVAYIRVKLAAAAPEGGTKVYVCSAGRVL